MSKVIVPKDIDIAKFEKAIDAAFAKTVDFAAATFGLTYATWESDTKPEFKTEEKIESGNKVVTYWTEDTPYVWIDNGTDGPYKIKAKSKPFLRFKTGGRPKSQPGRLVSGFGSPGTQWNKAQEVEHPGIEERGFSKSVKKEVDKVFKANVDEAL